MIFHFNPHAGVPIYVQIVEQVKHAIEVGTLHAGEQLPTIRKVAEDLIVNPNTVARAYRELEHAGIIGLKHGTGAFVSQSASGPSTSLIKAQGIVRSFIERLASYGLVAG